MKVIQEKLPASQIGLEIEIPAETTKKTHEKVVQNLAKSANIPGFRPGKVPRQILLQRLGTNAVKAAVIEELIENCLESALKQEAIESLGNPKLLSKFEDMIATYEPGKAFTFSASVDVAPTITLGDYENLNVTAEETAYDPESVENWFKERQEQLSTLIPVEDRGAEMGDVAIVDYKGKSAETGEDIPDIDGEDLRVDMEAGRFIEGMVEGIIGMKPEEVKEMTLTFPDDYPKEDVAGKPVIFTITMKELKAKELPELDDDFAQEVSDQETIAELRESLEKRFQEQADKETRDSIYDALTKELVKGATLDLPETMIEQEVTQVLTQSFMQFQQMGLDVNQLFTKDNIPKMRENARPDAIESLKQTLVVQELAKIEGIEVSPAAVQEKITKIMAQMSDRDIDMQRLEQVVTEEMLAENTLEWLKEKATVTLVPKGSLEEEETEDEETEETEETVAAADVEVLAAEEE
jgi:trigger factor